MTMRRWIVIVGVAAVAKLAIVKPFWDSAALARIARYHRSQAAIHLSRAMSGGQSDPGAYEKSFARFKWHQSMAARFARSAAYPGTPEPPDSPSPDP